MTTQSLLVKQNWTKAGNAYVGDRPEGATSGGDAALGWSAPSGLADGNAVSLTTDGTNPFGTGPTNVRFEDFSGGTLGQTIEPADTIFDANSQYYKAKYVSDSRSGSLAMLGVDTATTLPAINTVTLTSAREVFLSYAMKIPAGKYFPGLSGGSSGTDTDYSSNSSWKVAWLQDGDGATNDICVPTHVGNGSWYVGGNGLNNKLVTADMGGNKPTWFGVNNWTRIGAFLKAGDVPQTDIGKVYFQAVTSGQTLFETSKDVVVFEGGGATAPYHWTKLNISGWHAPNEGGSDGSGADVEYLFDDIYVAWGANAAARVELGNNVVYANCSDLQTQYVTPANWATGQLDFNINYGPFNPSEDLWYHITREDNNTRYSVRAN